MPESLAAPLALVALVVALAALALGFVAMRSGDAKPEPRPLPELVDADALETHLDDQHGRIASLATQVESLAGRTEALSSTGRAAVQHVGLVRFNPFEDTGSNQSFALAFLDDEANGVILSSLHSRQQTRVYVKEIVGGKCDVALSSEETEALRKAGLTV